MKMNSILELIFNVISFAPALAFMYSQLGTQCMQRAITVNFLHTLLAYSMVSNHRKFVAVVKFSNSFKTL